MSSKQSETVISLQEYTSLTEDERDAEALKHLGELLVQDQLAKGATSQQTKLITRFAGGEAVSAQSIEEIEGMQILSSPSEISQISNVTAVTEHESGFDMVKHSVGRYVASQRSAQPIAALTDKILSVDTLVNYPRYGSARISSIELVIGETAAYAVIEVKIVSTGEIIRAPLNDLVRDGLSISQ